MIPSIALAAFAVGFFFGREVVAYRTDKRIVELQRESKYWREVAMDKKKAAWPPIVP